MFRCFDLNAELSYTPPKWWRGVVGRVVMVPVLLSTAAAAAAGGGGGGGCVVLGVVGCGAERFGAPSGGLIGKALDSICAAIYY